MCPTFINAHQYICDKSTSTWPPTKQHIYCSSSKASMQRENYSIYSTLSGINKHYTIHMVWPWPSSLDQSESVWSAEMLDMAGSLCCGRPLYSSRLALWSTGLPSANKCERALAPHMALQCVCGGGCNLCACALHTVTYFSDAAILNEQCASWKLSTVKVLINQCRVWKH